ncbi:MAG: PAS domain S-box protein [Rhodospirillales bacterium]|nr:PAS domain S-box protein [Rhodospirillales bacterium]
MIWPWLMEGAAKRTSDILEGPAENGAQLVVAFQRSDVTNWLAVVAVPVAVAEGPTRQAALLLAAGVLASLILAVAAALVIGRRITGPLQSIAGEADGLIRGEPVLEKANSFSEIVEVRRALIKAAGLYRQGFETRLALEQEQRARAFAEQRREEAQKSERKIRRLIDANLIGVVIADDEQVFEANDAFFRIIGHSRAELEAGGLRWRALAPPEFQWLGDQALQELHERGEIAPFEQQYRRADGKEISVLLGAARIETDSSKLTWVCFVVDLTSQKQAQADLRQSEERYRALVMAISSVVWTTDPDGALRDPGHWCALTGQTPEQSAGWGWLNAIHPDDRQAARQVLASAIRERALINQSFRLRNRNGRYRWYSARGVPVFNADHTVREWVGVCFDIDEQKSAETGQQLLMAELDHRVRNILTTVQSMVSLTAPNVIAKEEYADLLRGRIAAMARTHSLLSRRAWNGATVVEILQDELAPFARNTGVISMDGDPELELRPKDVLDFAMVVHELTANAVRYGALSLPEGQVSVSWSVEGNDGGAMLRFVWRECNGPPVKARMYRGFGSRLIERVFNRGAARRALFDFDPDGLTCTLTMPLRPAYVPRTHHLIRSDGEKAPRYGSSAPRGRILVVQDETLVAMQLHRLLTQAGFEVSGPTERLSEALALSEDDTLTGAVIDMMPDPQGRLDLAVRLRGRGLPLLFVTDGVADSVPERFRGLPTVEKPIDPQAFLVAAGKAFHRFSSEEVATPEDRPAEAPAPVAFRN